MKKARAEDHWRRLKAKGQRCHIHELRGNSTTSLPVSNIPWGGAITAVTGLNGVGKSTLLRAIYALLRQQSGIADETPGLRNVHCQLTAEFQNANALIQTSVSLQAGIFTSTPSGGHLGVTLIDASFEVPELVRIFRAEQNLDELLEQTDPNLATAEELEEISQIVGKDYAAFELFELEEFHGRSVAPYFRAKVGDFSYGIESMGLGEAALFYICWHLKRLVQNSVILLEEPETYVSARSQTFLMDRLAEVCLKKNASAIITTHSPHVLERVPPSDTIILFKNGNQTEFIVKDCSLLRLRAIGVPPIHTKQGAFLLEDRIAREFFTRWIRQCRPQLLNDWMAVGTGSVGDVIRHLKNFPKLNNWFRVVGVLDGDENDKGHVASPPIISAIQPSA